MKESILNFMVIFFPSILIASSTLISLHDFKHFDFILLNQNKSVGYSAITITPIIETYFLMKNIDLYQTKRSENQKCLIIGLFWGLLHGILYIPSLLSSTWGFFWLSKIFIQTTNKFNKKVAFIQNLILHSVQNLCAFLLFNFSIIFE